MLDLQSIMLELSGTHTEGWWVGDLIEDPYVGPRGGMLLAKMDSASSSSCQWGARYEGGSTGPFTVTLELHRKGGGSDWSFLEDGVTDLLLLHDLQAGVGGGGGFTTPPIFDLTDVAVVINATPVPEPASVVLLGVGSLGLFCRHRKAGRGRGR